MTGLGRYSLLLGTAVLVLASTDAAMAKECRMPKAPPGVALQVPPECQSQDLRDAKNRAPQEGLRRENGFIDLGGGTQVRIGGSVRAETGFRY
ncbi:hypothetical protein [Microvirga rosea]|uniref:hypothetical protein n=1 Tax=Microvirga rosea TaxID=2715425 RepID=UPI001D0A6021|nr:hypothetical protein [Microvirga rosea]MCB8821029.1 hypothetical protein [Microvirga rosea]